MADDPIATRYAQALFETAKQEGQLEETLTQLTFIGRLLDGEPDLRAFLLNPDVEPDDTIGVLDRALKGGWSELVQSFVRMVISLGRADYLQQIAAAFQAIVDEEQGRLRAVARSARPLPEALLARLRTTLAQHERKEIELATELDPALLGGVQIRLDHRLIDGSIRRQLDDLHQRLTSIRVD